MISAWIGIGIFAALIVLNILLLFGAPLGEFTMGGQDRKLAKSKRKLVLISILIQIFAILILAQLGDIYLVGFSHNVARISAYILGGYMCLNTAMNFLSRSKKERLVMTPLAAVTAICILVTVINAT